MAKSIYEKQSESLIIQCLFAQRKKYSQAKMISGAYFFVCVVATCVFAVLKSITDNSIIMALSALLSLGAFVALSPINTIILKLKTQAAEIQQYIDVFLYSNEKYSSLNKKWSCPLSRDEIVEKVSKYPKSGFDDNDKWYEDYSSLSYIEQIYYCQRENIHWDRELRKKYYRMYLSIMGFAIVAIVLITIVHNPTFLKIITFIPWCLPFVKYLYSFQQQWKNDENRLRKMNDEANNIPNIGMISTGPEWIEREIELQEKIFTHRKEAILIPNFFYKICRTKQQKDEASIAENHHKGSNI